MAMTRTKACSECAHHQACVLSGMDAKDFERAPSSARTHRVLQRGDQLFEAGETMDTLFVLRSGCVKTWTLTEEGEEQIVRFHLSGEILGMNAIGSGSHSCTATALDTASVCPLPYEWLQHLADRVPEINHRLYRVMSNELSFEHRMLSLFGNRSAPRRVALFLIHLSESLQDRGFSSHEFNLSMARREIANYLGLSVETVSRTFSNFHNSGLLEVDGRQIRVQNLPGLMALGGLRDCRH